MVLVALMTIVGYVGYYTYEREGLKFRALNKVNEEVNNALSYNWKSGYRFGECFIYALDEKTNTSTSYVQLFLKGKYPMAPDFGILISDVKDVARAHVLSIKNPKVNGRRLIIGSEVKKLLELSEIMQEAFPQYAKKLPKKEMPIFMAKLISYFDSSMKKLVFSSLI
jgi:nucleoside-diphosphate-sugar epimerase